MTNDRRKEFPQTLVVNGLTYTKVEDMIIIENHPSRPLRTRGPFYSLPTISDRVFMPSIEYVAGVADSPQFMHPLPAAEPASVPEAPVATAKPRTILRTVKPSHE